MSTDTGQKSEAAFSEEMTLVIQAYQHIEASGGLNRLIRPSAYWKVLFDYYNARMREQNRPGHGMGCMSCYKPVYEFITSLLKSLNVLPE